LDDCGLLLVVLCESQVGPPSHPSYLDYRLRGHMVLFYFLNNDVHG